VDTDNKVNAVELRNGSSVPVIPQRSTNTQNATQATKKTPAVIEQQVSKHKQQQ
jgi:hypothetical protein